MKTRNSNKEVEIVQQNNGCCGSSVEIQPIQESCCGSSSITEEKQQTNSGCC